MTDKDILDRIASIVGYGNVRTEKLASGNHKTIYVWDIGGIDKVVPVLEAVRPYMGIRRGKKIDEMLKLAPTLRRTGQRDNEGRPYHFLNTKTNEEVQGMNYHKFCKERNLSPIGFWRIRSGRQETYKGWTNVS